MISLFEDIQYRERYVDHSLDSTTLDGVAEPVSDSLYISSDSSLYQADEFTYQDTLESVVAEAEQKDMNLFVSYAARRGEELPVMLSNSSGLFGVMLVCFLLLAMSFREIIAFIKENSLLMLSSKGEKAHDKVVTTKERFNIYLLVFACVLVLSISFYTALDKTYHLPKDYPQLLATIGLFVVALSTFLLIKISANKLIGYVFEVEDTTDIWSFSYLMLLGVLGGACFIPVLLLIYSKVEFDIIIAFVVILFLIVQLSVMIRVIMYFRSQKFSLLFLISYLCTVEIIPYLFLGIGMVYLYKVDIFNTVL